jgi:hypothetical protein
MAWFDMAHSSHLLRDFAALHAIREKYSSDTRVAYWGLCVGQFAIGVMWQRRRHRRW